MNARVTIDEARHSTNFEGEGGLLEACLHLAATEEAKTTTLFTRATFGVLHCEALEVLSGLYRGTEVGDVGNCFIL